MDFHRARARDDHRRAARQSGHDCGAAADGPEPRLRRVVRDAGRHSGVLSAHTQCASLHDGCAFDGSNSRLADVHRKFNGRGKTPGNPAAAADTYKGQNFVNLGLLAVAIIVAGMLVAHPEKTQLFPLIVGIPLLFGVMMIVPIGGADMPTVISLLNSYAGLSAAAMGFVLDSKLLIIAGALDGASGLILSVNMSKAMNRSFSNVLFGAFGQEQASATGVQEARPVRSATPEEAAAILAAANKVVIVPGYGMAVAQAQHKVRELYDALTKRGVDVKFGIHPVAGRMPGHMNVLLAEAD